MSEECEHDWEYTYNVNTSDIERECYVCAEWDFVNVYFDDELILKMLWAYLIAKKEYKI